MENRVHYASCTVNLVHSSTPNKSKTKDRATYSMAFLNKNAKFRGKGFNMLKSSMFN